MKFMTKLSTASYQCPVMDRKTIEMGKFNFKWQIEIMKTTKTK